MSHSAPLLISVSLALRQTASYTTRAHTHITQCACLLCCLAILASSNIWHFARNPVSQYGPWIQGRQRRNYGEKESWEVDPPVNSYIIDDPTALVPGFDVSGVFSTFSAVTLGDVQPVFNPLCICGHTQSIYYVTHRKRLSS